MLHTFVALVHRQTRRAHARRLALPPPQHQHRLAHRRRVRAARHLTHDHRLRRAGQRRAPHPRLALQARNHRRRRRGQPLRSRRPRALPHQGRRRPHLAARPALALADLRTGHRLPRPRRRPRARIHHARNDRLASKIEGLLQVLRESGYNRSSKSPAPAAWPCAAATTPAASSKRSATSPLNSDDPGRRRPRRPRPEDETLPNQFDDNDLSPHEKLYLTRSNTCYRTFHELHSSKTLVTESRHSASVS